MKSLSLDSPESSELHGHIKRRYPPPSSHLHSGGSAGLLDHNTPPSNNSRLHCKSWPLNFHIIRTYIIRKFIVLLIVAAPLSPSNARRLGYNRNMRTASVELPDDVEKSPSSTSTSPCSSPGRQNLAVSRRRCPARNATRKALLTHTWMIHSLTPVPTCWPTEIASPAADQFVRGLVQLQGAPCRRIGFDGRLQSNGHRYVRSGLVEGQMPRPRRLLPIEVLRTLAGGRKTFASHTESAIVGQRETEHSRHDPVARPNCGAGECRPNPTIHISIAPFQKN